MRPASPYLTAPEAALYLRIEKNGEPNIAAFYNYKRRRGIRAYRRGNRTLYRQCDLDACLEREPERRDG